MGRKAIELTQDEIELLREALGVLRDAPPLEVTRPDLFFPEYLQAEMRGEGEGWMKRKEQEIIAMLEARQDRIDLLAAKLVQMKDRITAREIASGLER